VKQPFLRLRALVDRNSDVNAELWRRQIHFRHNAAATRGFQDSGQFRSSARVSALMGCKRRCPSTLPTCRANVVRMDSAGGFDERVGENAGIVRSLSHPARRSRSAFFDVHDDARLNDGVEGKSTTITWVGLMLWLITPPGSTVSRCVLPARHAIEVPHGCRSAR